MITGVLQRSARTSPLLRPPKWETMFLRLHRSKIFIILVLSSARGISTLLLLFFIFGFLEASFSCLTVDSFSLADNERRIRGTWPFGHVSASC